jgi:acyl-CoA reductase-like NAD-dependent aldehyde dehydrogenase
MINSSSEIMYLQTDESGRSFVPNVINGKPVALPESRTFPVVQASTGKTVHYAQSATVDTAIAAVETAAKAFKSWKKTRIHERRELLNRVADILTKRVDEASKRNVLETSCAEGWPAFDVKIAASFVRETAATISTMSGSIPPSDNAEITSLVFKEPLGVVLIIPP